MQATENKMEMEMFKKVAASGAGEEAGLTWQGGRRGESGEGRRAELGGGGGGAPLQVGGRERGRNRSCAADEGPLQVEWGSRRRCGKLSGAND